MHELSICEALLTQVETLARQHQAQQVTLIKLKLGLLSGIEPELLQHAFSIARAGTLAENAELHISQQPIQIRCQTCQHTAEASPNNLACPHCQSWHTQLLSGDEMILQSVEMLTAD